MADSSRLSLCMIVRDSSRTLSACLSSIAPWVDEIIVVDTGSLDATRDIAAAHGAHVFDFPWCDDFSAARNESLRHATGHWIFWMDSDDTISSTNGRSLRSLANKKSIQTAPTAYVMQVHCPGPPGSTDCTVVDHVKMFRRDPRLRFEGRIHEQILPAIRRISGSIEWTDVFVTHSGSEHSPEAKQRKQQRDLRLLEMELNEKPKHPFVLFNLGMTYSDMEELPKAVDYLKRCLLQSSPDESHVRKAYALLVGCLTQLDEYEEAGRVLDRGRALFPDDVELSFRLGVLKQHTKDFDEAIAAYGQSLSAQSERYFSSRDGGITGFKARHNLAIIFRETGRHDLEEFQWRLAIDDRPDYWEGWHGLVDALLEQKKHVTLEIEIETARQRGLSEDELACAAAKLVAARGDVNKAVEILDVAAAGSNESIKLLRLKCQLLFDNAATERAIAALENLCQRAPTDGAAWHNLGTAYQKAGRHALAETCYQRSLAQRPNSIPTMLQLGFVHHELGRSDAARRVWQAARRRDPDNSAIRFALAELDQSATDLA